MSGTQAKRRPRLDRTKALLALLSAPVPEVDMVDLPALDLERLPDLGPLPAAPSLDDLATILEGTANH